MDIPTNTIDAHDADEGPFHLLSEQLGRSATTGRSVVRGVADTIREYGLDRAEETLDYHREDSVDGHYYLFNEAAKALERGEQPPVPLAHSRWVLELMEQVREDARADPAETGVEDAAAERAREDTATD
ncbi:hypothetical protein [Halorussus sp. MSC15.2]|uniref:hypothetical protein n=1 Tax=Halorussus sp. MSC15.2 TaxID=2283638 RepID=UPI0013D2EAEE|nr:hypothetical protein [Halorussus sp. MSC15.2]NEU56567.1 hypothetical protein [Halorussus sp. MSC15.2]